MKNNNIFSNVNEFAEYIRFRYFGAENFLSADELEARRGEVVAAWNKIIESQPENERAHQYIENFSNDTSVPDDPQKPMYSDVVHSICDEIYNSLPEQFSDHLRKTVSVSALTTSEINASIFKSPCNKYFAVMVNSSMIELLHKFGKLNIAAHSPETVIYYSRNPSGKTSGDEFARVRDEYILNFQRTKRSHGPIVHLNNEATGKHHSLLHVQELFLVGHELGHLMNGDFHERKLSDNLLGYVENEQHRSEHMADLIGFCFLLNAQKNTQEITKTTRISNLLAIIQLFNVFALLHDGETDTHPYPISRALCIADHFYGPAYTEMLANSYANFDLVDELINLTADIDSAEAEIAKAAVSWFYYQSSQSDEERHTGL